jgi:hypothetical protein
MSNIHSRKTINKDIFSGAKFNNGKDHKAINPEQLNQIVEMSFMFGAKNESSKTTANKLNQSN